MKQLLLPIDALHIPPRHVEWLRQANAADYPDKRTWFYPFKTDFLRCHAITDGLDLQIIKDRCWCGDGIWRGREFTVPERYWDTCWRCDGSGIYRTRRVVLIRWLLDDALFHEPSNFDRVQRGGADYRNIINGLIKHPGVDSDLGRRAMLKLFLIYDRPMLRRWIQYKYAAWRYRKERAVAGAVSRFRIRWHLEDDCPF